MISKSLSETRKIAADLKEAIEPLPNEAIVIALSGNLGSGKTTFTRYFAEALGIKEKEVASPTFVIMKSYELQGNTKGFKKFIHIDAYRLESAKDIERLGWRELVCDPNNLILIEWPENIGEAMPKNAKNVSFKHIDENTREIVFN